MPEVQQELSVEEAAKLVAELCSMDWLTATLFSTKCCLYRGEAFN